jgi:hypothetical protein
MAKDVWKGTIVQIDLAGGTSYTAVAQVKRLKIPKTMVGDVDVSCLDSTITEFIPDELPETDVMTFTLSWDPDLTGHQQFRGNIGTRGVKFQVVPPGNTGINTCTFTGYINGFDPVEGGPKDEMTAIVTVRPTSALTWVD